MGASAAVARSQLRQSLPVYRDAAADTRPGSEHIPQEYRDGLALLHAVVAHRPEPVLLIDEAGEVLLRNATARTMLESGGLLTVQRGRLRIAASGLVLDGHWLRGQAADESEPAETEFLRFELPTGSSEPRAFAEAQRLQSANGRLEPDLGYWLLTVYFSRRYRRVNEDKLRRWFGLTPAESRLVAVLFTTAGRLEDVAAQLGVTRETARSHLRSVFQKCEVRSQVELVQLVALGPFF